MNYSKIILTLGILLTFVCPTYAFYLQRWQNLENNTGVIAIDKESVNIHNDSVYYTIRYCKGNEGVVYVVIQSKGDKAGIVDTYKFTIYDDIMQSSRTPHPAATEKVAPKLNPITPSSKLYEANKLAIEIARYNTPGVKYDLPDKEIYLKSLEKSIKKNWWIEPIHKDTHVVYVFKIAKDNKILNTKLIDFTGDKNAAKEGFDAIKRAIDWVSLPRVYNGQNLEIEFTLDYKIIKSRKHFNITACILTDLN